MRRTIVSTILSLGILLPLLAPAEEPDPSALLQDIHQIRIELEQEAKSSHPPVRQPAGPPAEAASLDRIRERVSTNLDRLGEGFRCLDVEVTGNQGNVILVCGENSGVANSAQAGNTFNE